MEDLKQAIGRALGRIPSGVFVLTVRHDGQSAAMLASWVQQVAFEPPAVAVAIARQRPIGQLIEHSRRLAISIIAQDDSTLMRKYARGIPSDQDPFGGMHVLETPGGMPVLSDALAWLDCRLLAVCRFDADHELFVAQVTGGEMLRDGSAFTHQRGNGFHY